jgi:galactokinase
VLPIAIDRYTTVRASARPGGRVQARSAGYAACQEFDPAVLAPPPAGSHADDWGDYLRAVAWALRAAGHAPTGARLEITSEVPQGAGLSSSAALEVACASALLALAGRSLATRELALLCQRAENEYVGARCGIMDQYVVSHARAGHALLLDCRTLTHRHVPLRFAGIDTRIVVCNTMVRHRVAGGEYNLRRAQCEAGVAALATRLPGLRSLRDLDPGGLAALVGEPGAQLDPVVARRCRHVVTENQRVLAAGEALERGDPQAFGALMTASHASMRDDYAISCRELDIMVELAAPLPGVFGARMTGGGFGGCTVNLVRAEAVAAFSARVSAGYEAATGRVPQVFVCSASAGASVTQEGSA